MPIAYLWSTTHKPTRGSQQWLAVCFCGEHRPASGSIDEPLNSRRPLSGDLSHGVANRPEAQLGDARVDVGRAQWCDHGGQQLIVVDRGPFHRWWSAAPHRYFDGSAVAEIGNESCGPALGTLAHAGKSGRGRSPRSWFLGAGEPVNECDPGSRWWGCALLLRARGSDSFHPVRFLRATASL